MKRVFLMDYENTAVRGLLGISELGYGDKVVVFCSNENIKRALTDLLKIYEERRVEIRVHLLKKRALNALDFMITTYLGFEVSMDDEKEIYVISADKGYESAIDMAHELSNGIFIGFHESIYECIHERYAKALPAEDEPVTIEATAVMIDHEEQASIGGESYKALTGPVAEEKKAAPTEKKRGFGPFSLGGKKKPATNRQRDAYRKAFMDHMKSEGKIPEQYINQLTAFMDKSTDSQSFRDRAVVALGTRNKDYVDIAVEYFKEYDKKRP